MAWSARPRVCPHCGALMPVPGLFGQARVRQRIFDYIRAHPGCAREEIVGAVYAADPNGGPLERSTLSVHIHNMQGTLASHGMRIESVRGRHGGAYRVVEIKVKQGRSRGSQEDPE